MKKINLLFITLLLFVWNGCILSENDGISNSMDGLISLELPYDTLIIEEQEELVLSVFGSFYSEEFSRLGNQGVLAGYVEKELIDDTTSIEVNPNKLDWIIAKGSVAKVKNGVLIAKEAGLTSVRASYKNIKSNPITLIVETPGTTTSYDPPTLILDEPERIVTFSSSGIVSGSVSLGSKLYIGQDRVSYRSDGSFTEVVDGLVFGENIVEVSALHPTRDEIGTYKSKIFIYEDPAVSSSVIGTYYGSGDSYTIEFDIYFEEDVITLLGLLTLDFDGFGSISDILVYGSLDPLGQMQANLAFGDEAKTTFNTLPIVRSRFWDRFVRNSSKLSVEGSLEGFVSDEGISTGSLIAILETASRDFNESADWLAEKTVE